MRIAPRFVFLTWFLAAATHAAAEDFTNAIKALLRDHIELDRRSIGMVVGIVDEEGQRVVSYGKVDSSAGSPDVNGDTIFEIGSVTKTFTTLLLEGMVERGEMNLNDPAANYLPGPGRMPSRHGKKITLLHLATHMSGLPSDPDNLSPLRWNDPYAGYTQERLYEFLSDYNLPRDPGDKFEYSNLGMDLLAEAISQKAGTNFESLVLNRICGPLQMSSTRITMTPGLRARAAAGHDFFLKAADDMTFPRLMLGAGAIHSSANDLLKYLSANIGLKKTGLSPLMEKTHVARAESQALAWQLSGDIVWHGGATFGSVAFVGFDKKRRRGVVVLSNSMYDPATDLGFLLLNSEWRDNKRPKVGAFSSRNCVDLTGTYQVTSNSAIGIRCELERLFMRGSVHLSTELIPDSEGSFFMRVSGAPTVFTRNTQGRVTGLVSAVYGKEPSTFMKISANPPKGLEETKLPAIASISPKAFDDCEGQYQLPSGTAITLSHERDHLITKSEGQMTVEFYPESETNFFCPYLPVRIEIIKNGKSAVIGFTITTDLADKGFAGKIWRRIRPPISDPFFSRRNIIVLAVGGIALLLLFASSIRAKPAA